MVAPGWILFNKLFVLLQEDLEIGTDLSDIWNVELLFLRGDLGEVVKVEGGNKGGQFGILEYHFRSYWFFI